MSEERVPIDRITYGGVRGRVPVADTPEKRTWASSKLADVRIMRVTLKAINEALNGLAPDVRLAKGDGYFYFTSGETANWLDTTVRVPTLSSLTLEQWIEEFKRLKTVNKTLLSGKADDKTSIEPKSRAAARRRQK
jgi:hypothetical protein